MKTKTKAINMDKALAPHVLILDDDSMIRTMLTKILNNEYYQPDAVATSGEALERLIDYKYDIMLLDAKLPGISGFELLKYCKKNHSMMEIIMITGNQDLNSAVTAMKDGAFDYITKPFSITKILEVMQKAIVKYKENSQNSMTDIFMLGGKKTKILPGYNVIRTIGSGTMGVVFLVKKGNIEYALKVLREDEESIKHDAKTKRFIREGKILSTINHNNIVKVHSTGFLEGESPYILMEYISGKILTHYIKENSLTIEQKVFIIGQLASALATVHKKGILHRDIKPGNIIIKDGYIPKLLDFGISRIANSSLTMEYEILGSPAYMPPETFDSNDVDLRADIFSLGIVSYELLTGQKPFNGETVNDIMYAIQFNNPIEPQKINKRIPSSIQSILAKMLKKIPKHRYNKASEIVQDINNLRKPATTATHTRLISLIKMNKDWS